uniref:Uncharacterized protein n=1 Tax=Cacopsylla melanoneura TaxID=428564 RepID=A0A8D8YEU1_9HEMI
MELISESDPLSSCGITGDGVLEKLVMKCSCRSVLPASSTITTGVAALPGMGEVGWRTLGDLTIGWGDLIAPSVADLLCRFRLSVMVLGWSPGLWLASNTQLWV